MRASSSESSSRCGVVIGIFAEIALFPGLGDTARDHRTLIDHALKLGIELGLLFLGKQLHFHIGPE